MLKLQTSLKPAGDQPEAIDSIITHLNTSSKHHVLLGATGSGKTFTMANVIERMGSSALVIAPNKTLAAQLYMEFKELFPGSPVGFFISYYDYYQPEAYLPATDTYIAKDSAINDDIDKMRHEATRFLFEKPQSIIVASVSCIYGLGSPESYAEMAIHLKKDDKMSRDALLRQLVGMQFSRNDWSLTRGHFRVRGDTVDIMPAYEKESAVRVEFWGDEIIDLKVIDALTGKIQGTHASLSIYPNSHYVTSQNSIKKVIKEILVDLQIRLTELKEQNDLVAYQRLEQRTMQDIESLEQLGFCPGIENYSRYLTGTKPGDPPPCLLDYFPKGFLTIIDESHITVPQIRAMYRGDRARKENLVHFGFRLPSALDNRPLNYEEFLKKAGKILHVSATPSEYDLEVSAHQISEQIIRPTGLLDPEIFIRPGNNQVGDLLDHIKETIAQKGRVLVTTLTKKMAEDLTQHYKDLGIKVRYLHSDIDSLERSALLRDLRKGTFDVLIGINLLREGLDLPEVMLVAVMDADKEGFLRSRTSLIQIVGRAARNHQSKVLFYADRITGSMQETIDETARRRKKQAEHNEKYGITPQTVFKNIPEDLRVTYGLVPEEKQEDAQEKLAKKGILSLENLEKELEKKKKQMLKFSKSLEFEKAAQIRDEIKELSEILLLWSSS